MLALAAAPVHGHELLLRYQLPVPFALYLYASGATLVATFVLLGWFMKASRGDALVVSTEAPAARRVGRISGRSLSLLRAAAVAVLAFVIAAGLAGTRDPDHNISLVLFWQVFLLGVTYATAIVGNAFEFLNPWRVSVDLLQKAGVLSAKASLAYPPGLAYWPALLFYIALIWLELFTHLGPRGLSAALIVYTLLTIGGAQAFGKAAWFRYCEVFSVLLRVVGALAPVAYRPDEGEAAYVIALRPPFSGVLEERAEHMSMVVFVLFMLASTTFDGIHQTVLWMGLYWNHLLVAVRPLWTADLAAASAFERWYVVYQHLGLVLSPAIYLAIYLAILRVTKAMTKTTLSLRSLALDFAYTIVPIALVYNVAHYFTLLLTQAATLPYLLSDPLGLGWDIFGAGHPGEPPILDMAVVWHIEVALILIGHVVSVYLAHRVALKVFASRRDAILSQLPMLGLMVCYTLLGLWVISLPIALTH